MSKKKRYLSLLAIVDGSKINNGSKNYIAVRAELGELGFCDKVSPEKRRGLLQVLHSTRALDSSLKIALSVIGVTPSYSIGKHLDQFHSTGRITKASATRYKHRIASVRNRYMHEANAFPSSSKDADQLVAEIETCLVDILRTI
jgi:hypothetical protein